MSDPVRKLLLLIGLSPALGLYRYTTQNEFTTRLIRAARALKNRGVTTLVLDHSRKYGAGVGMGWIANLGPALAQLGLDVFLHHKVGWCPRDCRPGEAADQHEPGVWHLGGRGVTVEQRFDSDSIQEEVLAAHAIVQTFKAHGVKAELWIGAHDPDELILAAGLSPAQRQAAMDTLTGQTYPTLFRMQASGQVKAVSIGAKSWQIAHELVQRVEEVNIGALVDVIMPSNCWTAVSQPDGLRGWMDKDGDRRTFLNAGVFNGGALTNRSNWFNYHELPEGHLLLQRRDRFQQICDAHGVSWYNGAIAVALSHRAWKGVALGLGGHIGENIDDLYGPPKPIPPAFFAELHQAGLITAATFAELS